MTVLADPSVQAALNEVVVQLVRYLANDVLIPNIQQALNQNRSVAGDSTAGTISPKYVPLAEAVTASSREAVYRGGVRCTAGDDDEACRARFAARMISFSEARVSALEQAYVDCRDLAARDPEITNIFRQVAAIDNCVTGKGFAQEIAAITQVAGAPS